MGLTHLTIHYPRFKLSSADLRAFYPSPALSTYSYIGKFGIDEDATTLAVNAFLDLVETVGEMPKRLYLSTGKDFNSAVFLDATGINSSDVVHVPIGEVGSLQTIWEASRNEGCAFLVVDSPRGKNEKVDAYCSAAAVTGFVGKGGVEISSFDTFESASYSTSRYGSQGFDPADESMLISTVKEHLVPNSINFINFSSLKQSSRMIPNLEIKGQKTNGFSGITSGLVSLFSWLHLDFNSDVQLSIYAIDENGGASLSLQPSEKPIVIINDRRKDISLPTYLMQKEHAGNESIPQGAFISTPVYFSQKGARYRLNTAKCKDCGFIHFPPRQICKNCGSQTVSGKPLKRYGKLYTFTKILKGAAPPEFDIQQALEGDYCVGLVEFEEGPKVISQLTDVEYEDLEVDMPMKMVFRKIYRQDETDRYGYKFTCV